MQATLPRGKTSGTALAKGRLWQSQTGVALRARCANGFLPTNRPPALLAGHTRPIESLAIFLNHSELVHCYKSYAPSRLERSIANPVVRRAVAITRLKLLPAIRCASRALIHAMIAWVGAMQTQTTRSMLPSWVNPCGPGPSAATIVARILTTTPTYDLCERCHPGLQSTWQTHGQCLHRKLQCQSSD